MTFFKSNSNSTNSLACKCHISGNIKSALASPSRKLKVIGDVMSPLADSRNVYNSFNLCTFRKKHYTNLSQQKERKSAM